MILKELLLRIPYIRKQGSLTLEIVNIVHNSKKVVSGSLFICVTGMRSDGHNYVEEAIKGGAIAVVAEREVPVPDDITLILVDNSRRALSYIAAAFYGYPSEKMTMIGITGTKGKTTCTYMLEAILEEAGYRTGIIGTIEVSFADKRYESYNTTPDALLLQEYLSEMVQSGVECVVMEVSSQGLMLHRTDSIVFDYGIFTNISEDHIGPTEHKNFEEYLSCKAKLFSQCKVAIVNSDCEFLPMLLKDATCRVYTYGLSRTAMLYAQYTGLLQRKGALGISFVTRGCLNYFVELWLPGVFNVYNALAAFLTGRQMGINGSIMVTAMSKVSVKGRCELVPVSDDYTTIIDYAHNADSLYKVLHTIREYHPKRIVCLFGCGGNRDRQRRFEMGEIAAKYSDVVIVTSDNPREESQSAIIDDIVIGIERYSDSYIRIEDRSEAIHYALDQAIPGDVILFAGKGHETYQEICGVRYPMDERVIIEEWKGKERWKHLV